MICTSASSWPVAVEHVLEQVVRQRARRHDALLGEGDRGRLDGADPDRQVALTRRLAQQHDRLVGGHLDPDSDDIDLAHAVQPTPRQRGSPGATWASRDQRARAVRLDQRGVQPDRQRAELGRPSRRPGPALLVALPGQRADDLLDQPDLAVGRGLERPDVPRLEPERGELRDRLATTKASASK